jgi:dTDP-glucose 4,6-dehydratase/UDP-glucose 4-epimerase
MTEPFADLEINVAAQLSMLEACRRVAPAIRIVYTSTRQVYGMPDYLPVDEKHPVRPADVNGINKLAGEGYHILYGKVYGIRSTVLRLTNTYGPGMRIRDARQTFLGIWFRSLLEGRPIQVFGDGTQLRDLTYVDDCVEALLSAGASDIAVGRVYNLGGEEVVSLLRLAEVLVEIGQEMGIEGDYNLVPFPTERKVIDIGDYHGDFSLATNDLGWRPRTELRAGLRRSLDYYRLNHRQYWED